MQKRLNWIWIEWIVGEAGRLWNWIFKHGCRKLGVSGAPNPTWSTQGESQKCHCLTVIGWSLGKLSMCIHYFWSCAHTFRVNYFTGSSFWTAKLLTIAISIILSFYLCIKVHWGKGILERFWKWQGTTQFTILDYRNPTMEREKSVSLHKVLERPVSIDMMHHASALNFIASWVYLCILVLFFPRIKFYYRCLHVSHKPFQYTFLSEMGHLYAE